MSPPHVERSNWQQIFRAAADLKYRLGIPIMPFAQTVFALRLHSLGLQRRWSHRKVGSFSLDEKLSHLISLLILT